MKKIINVVIAIIKFTFSIRGDFFENKWLLE